MDGKRFYRPDEVAQMFGVSVRFVWYRIKKGEIKHVHIRRLVRVPREEIDRIIQAGLVLRVTPCTENSE